MITGEKKHYTSVITEKHQSTRNTLYTKRMDTVLRHVQDVKVTNRFGNMDAVLRHTQDVKVSNKLKVIFKAHCLWIKIDFLNL